MAPPARSGRAGRPGLRNVPEPWAAPAFLALSASLAVAAALYETGRTGLLVMAAVWLVVGLTVLHVRRREVRRLLGPGGASGGNGPTGTAGPSH